jgi:hypothetical protein
MHPLTANAAQQTQPREDGVYRTLTYLITSDRIVWAGSMTDSAILAGRRAQERRRRAYYESLPRRKSRKGSELTF